MASDPGKTFGFELLYKISSEQIVKKEDVLILLIHWYFVRNGFRCLGVGDSKTIGPSEIGSELLPEGWSTAPNYTLRYIKDGKLYILIGVKSEEDLLLNLLKIEDHSVANLQFPINVVNESAGPLEFMIPTYEVLLNKIKTELIDIVVSESAREVSTQTSQTSESDIPRREDDDPLRVGPPQRSGGSLMHRPEFNRHRVGNIGSNDLDPFGGGRGMIFDPFVNSRSRHNFPGIGGPGQIPSGMVPPGARFDPFGPPDNNPPRRLPDSDHLPPPGYDDMFL